MSGDATKTNLWADADVYIAPLNTAGPADVTTSWAAAWKLVGLLDGAEGFTESRESETSEKYAWGGHLYKRTSSKHKRTIKFVALEDNDTTFALVNPGSTRTATASLQTSVVKAPKAGERFAIGFETREGAKTKRRIAKIAEVESVGEIKSSEEEPTVYEITVVIFPEANGTLYTDLQSLPAAP